MRRVRGLYNNKASAWLGEDVRFVLIPLPLEFLSLLIRWTQNSTPLSAPTLDPSLSFCEVEAHASFSILPFDYHQACHPIRILVCNKTSFIALHILRNHS